MIQEEVINKLGNNIRKHIELYPKLSVKAEQFESLFACATGSDWTPYNHNPGSDMITSMEGMRKPSLKSGIIKDGFLTISSHRTTKFDTIDKKIDFLCNTDYDSYICLARPDKKIHTYKLVYFTKSTIDFKNLTWSHTLDKKGKQSGWIATNENHSIRVRIIKNMSDQVWIDIHESLINILNSYNYDVTE